MEELLNLHQQTKNVYQWTNRLLESVPLEKWEVLPEVLQTSVNWQVGHLIVSHYYHSIWVVKGFQMEIARAIPLQAYGETFTSGAPGEAVGKFDSKKLLEHLHFVQEQSLQTLSGLQGEVLPSPLEPTGFPHPIATTKREAIEWNIQHTMYHNGQLGLLARVLEKRFDFGLKK